MDIDLTPTSTKSPDDNEIDTPPHTGNGGGSALKHHHHLHHRRRPPISAAYKECMKNHAAAIGGHAVDGCGEFMPPPHPPSTATAPAALTCAACGCHRNFHRRDPESPNSAAAIITPPFLDFRHPAAPLPKRFSLSLSPSPPPPAAAAPHVFFAAAEDHHPAPVTPTVENAVGRKRFRTKFSQDQKDKMRSFSMKLGWKMQKCDEAAVKEFCHEIGVSKGVLKVWMHNNKHTFKTETTTSGGGGIANDSVISFEHSGGSGSGSGGGGGGGEERKIDRNGNIFVESGNGSVHRFYGSSSSPA